MTDTWIPVAENIRLLTRRKVAVLIEEDPAYAGPVCVWLRGSKQHASKHRPGGWAKTDDANVIRRAIGGACNDS